jgi:hypothetical protein
MSELNEEPIECERILRRVRTLAPSDELKGRIMQAAQEAWRDTVLSVPWQVPVGRLVVSTMAATIVISLANLYGDRASANRPVHEPTAERAEPCDLDVTAEPNPPLVRYAVTAGSPAQPDASALFAYLKRFREALREMEHNETPDGPDPMERRSRLLPTSPRLHS